MNLKQNFKAYFVRKNADGKAESSIINRKIGELTAGDVLINVAYSSLNYKDALSATCAPGVTRNYPHTPGIDAAGKIVQSESPDFKIGDSVLVTGYDLGVDTDGGYGQYIRVPAEWVVPLPAELSLKESMILGTAGFTAGLCLQALLKNSQDPKNGDIIVTGASGGVGSIAVALLAKVGFNVIASTGKFAAHDYLKKIGAAQVIDRSELNDQSGRPLLKSRWSGAVDTVGGDTLSTVIRSAKHHSNIAICGLAGGNKLDITVFPLIIRGVNLLGIDSATSPKQLRLDTWQKFSSEWKLDNFDLIAKYIKLDDLDTYVNAILKGEIMGRLVVDLNA